jgi:hypothetical protein
MSLHDAHIVLRLTPAAAALTQHEPALAVIEVANRTNAPVAIDLGLNRRNHVEVLVAPPGGVPAWTRIPPREGGGRPGDIVLAPDETQVEPVFLNEWRPPEEVGVHRYEPRFLSVAFESAPPAPIVPSPCLLTVLPRDEELLRRRCTELSDAAIGALGRAARLDAVSTLAWMHDPVAVPFIETTLAEAPDEVWPDLLPALAAIDVVPALELLYREAVTPREGLPASGRPSLARLLLYKKARNSRRVGEEDLWRRIDGLFARQSSPPRSP